MDAPACHEPLPARAHAADAVTLGCPLTSTDSAAGKGLKGYTPWRSFARGRLGRMAMNGLVEIRWHGRGGQGTATAARMAAGLASAQGEHFQAFPAFHDDSPPRHGEPVVAFTRISDRPIEEHAEIGCPGIVVLLDGSVLHTAEVTQGLASDAILLVNSDLSAAELRSRYSIKGLRLFCVAATAIARETAGSAFPNTAMIGALARISGLFPIESVAEFVRVDFAKRFPPEVVEGNVKAAIRSYGEVRGEGDDAGAADCGRELASHPNNRPT